MPAVLTKTWTFTSNAEGWLITETSGSWTGSGWADGELYVAHSSDGTVIGHASWMGTFEDLGIPMGADILRLKGSFYRSVEFGTNGEHAKTAMEADNTTLIAEETQTSNVSGERTGVWENFVAVSGDQVEVSIPLETSDAGGGSPATRTVDVGIQSVTLEIEYEEVPVVVTHDQTAVSKDGATLNGDLTEMAGYAEVDCFFEYRETGETIWNETTKQTLTSIGTFNETVALDGGREYEFRAVGEYNAETTYGTILVFSTTAIVEIERSDGDALSWFHLADVADPDVDFPNDYLDEDNLLDAVEYFYRARRWEDGLVSDWSNIDSVIYTGVAEHPSGEAHITATSEVTVLGKKVAVGYTVAAATSETITDGRKVAKGEVSMTATTELVVAGQEFVVEVGTGEAHIKTLSSFEVVAERRSRSPPVETEADSKISMVGKKVGSISVKSEPNSQLSVSGRKVAKGESSIEGDSETQVTGKKVVPANITLDATSKVEADGKRVAQGIVEETATSELYVASETTVSVEGEAHVTAVSSLDVSGKKQTSASPVDIDATSETNVYGNKVVQGEAVVGSESQVSAEGSKLADTDVNITTTSDSSLTDRAVKKQDADMTADSQLSVSGRKIAESEAIIDIDSVLQVTGKKISSADTDIDAISKVSVDGDKTAQNITEISITSDSELSVSGRKKIKVQLNISSNAIVLALSKAVVKGQVNIDGNSDLSIGGKKTVSVITEMVAVSDMTIQSQRFVPAPYLDAQQVSSVHRLVWGVD